MDIEINEKKNNPLLNRTEVHFTINHEGEGTPNREIIRSEIAEKLNVKKDNIIISNISSSFGVQKSRGYAKIYSNQKKSVDLERKYIIKRNQSAVKEKKKEEDKKQPEIKETDEKATGEEEQKVESTKVDEKPDEKSTETEKKDIKDETTVEKNDEKKE
jgi:small subunit ribosomal protein S24e